jgi:hypothetical protein
MTSERWKAGSWAFLATSMLGLAIAVGSRDFRNFDAALIGYTFATLFAAFGVVYRYLMWLQRPPTAMYWRRGWTVFFRPGHLARNIRVWFHRVFGEFAANEFIFRRSKQRWLTHMLLMWGCILASAITFPLVFGWIHFATLPGHLDYYQVHLFGIPTFSFPIESWFGFTLFHGLVWASFLVIAGCMLALRRRMRDAGAQALQQFGEDWAPLIMLFAVSVTGLMLTASYTWMRGYAYDFLAILHAVTVIGTLIWMPFGKFFHIFQRPAQLGVNFYHEVGSREEQAQCLRCELPFASQMHVEDLMIVERQLGYAYELEGEQHYQQVCPACRRAMFGLAQDQAWKGTSGDV